MDAPGDETRFFGRGREIADVEGRLGAGARLVTLVGLPGIGKSRIAIEVAAKKRASFVSLAEAATLEAALHTIAKRTRMRAATTKTDDPTATLGSALGARLLVLDGVDALGPAALDLVDGLRRGGPLSILATARAPIGSKNEEKIALAPLDVEDAALLLADRARLATGKDVAIAAEDARAIVDRLDRVPLAIELAASRLGVLSPRELRTRLEEGKAAPMDRALDAAWEMLDPAERTALVQCAVFAAPFGVEAAEQIVVIRDADTLDVLERLVDKSLLARAEGSGPARLRLLETVRTWAGTKLAQEDEARVRHARYHIEQAERWAGLTYGTEADRAFDALSELLPELETVAAGTDVVLATRAVLAAEDLLRFRSFSGTRGALVARAVVAAEMAKDDDLLARALVARARITLDDARASDAEADLARAKTLARDPRVVAEAERSRGWALLALNRMEEAEAALAAAEGAHRAHGSARGIADARVAFGLARAFQGKSDDALAALREALAIHVEQGDVLRQEKVFGFAALAGHGAAELARGLPRDVLARAPEESLSVLPSAVKDAVAEATSEQARWMEALGHYRRGMTEEDPKRALGAFESALDVLARAKIARGASSIRAHAAVAIAQTGDLAEADAWIARARNEAKDVAGAGLVVEVFASAVAALRGDKATARARQGDIRGEGGPELAVARGVLERVLDADGGAPSIVAPLLLVAAESRSFVVGAGERVDLTRYGPARRLLDALVEARVSKPGQALSAEDMIAAGWPNERMRHTAGLLRVYSAVRRLRRLGLESFLLTRDDGYLLDPGAVVRRSE